MLCSVVLQRKVPIMISVLLSQRWQELTVDMTQLFQPEDAGDPRVVQTLRQSMGGYMFGCHSYLLHNSMLQLVHA